jgi:uncharacterized membrane protein HdeD (DUF308 family)
MSPNLFATGIDEVRSKWGWFLILGIALIVLGTISLSVVAVATLVSVFMFGWLLVFAGAVEAVSAFGGVRERGFLLHLFVGILYAVGGFLILAYPAASATGLTLLLAALFLIGGLFRMLGSATLRHRNWGWGFFDGLVTFILAVLIWRAWPSSSLWVLGMFLGITLLLRGWSWVMVAIAAHRLPRIEEPAIETMRPAA